MKLSGLFYPDPSKRENTERLQRSRVQGQYIVANVACLFLLFGSFLAFFYGTSGNVMNIIYGSVFLIMAILLFRFSRTYRDKSLQTLSTAILNPPAINPFNVAHPVKRGVFGVATVLSEDETIIAPTAPISIGGWDAASIGSTSGGETNNQSVNTFICTNHQIICALLGYADAASGPDFEYTNSMDEPMRNFQFTLFHKGDWHEITDNALAQGLPDFVERHFSYAFPYSGISSIKPVTHLLLNHSLDIELTDGKVISYTFLNADDRTPVLEQLKSYVNIVEE